MIASQLKNLLQHNERETAIVCPQSLFKEIFVGTLANECGFRENERGGTESLFFCGHEVVVVGDKTLNGILYFEPQMVNAQVVVERLRGRDVIVITENGCERMAAFANKKATEHLDLETVAKNLAMI